MADITHPIVSVIVPAYNAEKYIPETIQSVLGQTYEAWELIIVDDGSTDKTAETVAAFDDRRIRLVEQENRGVGAARNAGIALAQGDYITFLDADDVLPPESLAARVRYLEEHPEVDVVDGRIVVKDPAMEKTIRTYEPYYSGELLPRLLALDSRVFFNVCYMFRREALGAVRFKEQMSHVEDLLFYIELSDHCGAQYGFVDKAVYFYRSGHTSAMANLDGIEKGYIALLSFVDNMANILFAQKCFLHLKVLRIIFLSWLNRNNLKRALKSLRIFFMIS